MSRLVSPVRAAGVFAAAAVFAACAGDPVSVPSNLVARADGVQAAALKTLQVCKIGPVGSYTFSLTRSGNIDNDNDVFGGTATVNADVHNLTLTTVNGTDPACATVYSRTYADNASGDALLNLMVTENVPSGQTLQSITFSTPDNAPPADIANPSITMYLNAFHSGTATFTNVARPSSGCTYTIGWYKNKGKATIAGMTLNGVSYLEILNTSPAGNPYYILAHQYIAASMNKASGASSTTAVNEALDAAVKYFSVATALNPYPNNPDTGIKYTKAQITGWATTLDNYNNGLVGPGHCD